MSPDEIASWEWWLGFWESVGYASAFTVLLGVVGEYIDDFTSWFPRARIEKRLGKVSTLALIAGLAVELVALYQTTKLSGRILEAERLARVKIEEKLAWRSLTAEQRTKLAATLAPFAHQKLNMFLYRHPEASSLGQAIINTLSGPGGSDWYVRVAGGTEGDRIVTGLLVEIVDGASLASQRAAVALAGALKEARLEVRGPTLGLPGLPSGMFIWGLLFEDAEIKLTVGMRS